jgi:hypothetical protein
VVAAFPSAEVIIHLDPLSVVSDAVREEPRSNSAQKV